MFLSSQQRRKVHLHRSPRAGVPIPGAVGSRDFALPLALASSSANTHKKNKKAREDHRLCHSPSSPEETPDATNHQMPFRPEGIALDTLLFSYVTCLDSCLLDSCLHFSHLPCPPIGQGIGPDPNFKRKQRKMDKLESSGVGALVFIL